jgi:hypothetical protein
LLETTPSIGRFVGIEHRLLSNSGGLLTPDLTALYDEDSKGILFDLKHSLPSDPQAMKDEVMKLEKYKNAKSGWGVPGVIDPADFVLVCHLDDAKQATEAAREVYRDFGKEFFSPESFSVWSWTIGLSKHDERLEEMRLLHMYGATRNIALQQMITDVAGILVPEEVLTSLRFTQAFVREKPPVQYTVSFLIQNVFSALPPVSLSVTAQREEYTVTLDSIAQKTNVLFPPWWESDVETVQVKRSWIREAMEMLVRIRMISAVQGKPESYLISPRKLASRKQLPQVICERLVSLAARRPRGRPPSPRRVQAAKTPQLKSLTDYLG